MMCPSKQRSPPHRRRGPWRARPPRRPRLDPPPPLTSRARGAASAPAAGPRDRARLRQARRRRDRGGPHRPRPRRGAHRLCQVRPLADARGAAPRRLGRAAAEPRRARLHKRCAGWPRRARSAAVPARSGRRACARRRLRRRAAKRAKRVDTSLAVGRALCIAPSHPQASWRRPSARRPQRGWSATWRCPCCRGWRSWTSTPSACAPTAASRARRCACSSWGEPRGAAAHARAARCVAARPRAALPLRPAAHAPRWV